MDLSGLIFVALAVAWAAYLIPKALRHHDEVARGRSVDGFSDQMRVLARREPVSATVARLVVDTDRPKAAGREVPPAVRRAAAQRATRRRRRVLSGLLLVLLAVVVTCAAGRLAWPFVAIPVVLLAAWLVACRLMVKKERAWRPVVVAEAEAEDEAPGEVDAESAAEQTQAGASGDPVSAQGLWDPVPVTLPTYVSKPPARRTVRTIDLDSTGVWTSGRTQADSQLAREADAAEAAERVRRRTSRKGHPDERAVGS